MLLVGKLYYIRYFMLEEGTQVLMLILRKWPYIRYSYLREQVYKLTINLVIFVLVIANGIVKN